MKTEGNSSFIVNYKIIFKKSSVNIQFLNPSLSSPHLPLCAPHSDILSEHLHEVVWCVVFREVYWIFSRPHPFIELVVIELLAVITPDTFVWRVAIDNISFSVFIVLVVLLCVFYPRVQ